MEVIDRIVGGAYRFYMIFIEQSPRCERRIVGEFVVALVKDLACCLRVEALVDAESRFQLQMRPVVERVAERVGHRLCPLLKLLPVAGVFTGAVFLGYAVAAHCAPLIVIAAEPHFRNGAESFVLGNLLRNEVTVIIDDGHLCSMLVIEFLCSFCLQQKVLIHELFHLLFEIG